MMRLAMTSIALLVGCTSPASTTDTTSLPTPPSLLPTGPHYRYVIDHVTLPITPQPGNAFATGLASLANAGFDVQGAMDRALADGSIILLVDLQADDLADSTASVGILAGAQPSPSPCTAPDDTVCGHHLDGTGSFVTTTFAPSLPVDPPLLGSIGGGALAAHGQTQMFELALFGNLRLVVQLGDVLITTSTVTPSALDLHLSALVSEYAWDDHSLLSIAGGLAFELPEMVARDCTSPATPPGCGCTAGSLGEQLLAYFAPGACTITSYDIDTSPLHPPDDSQYNGGAFTFGVDLTAVPATF